MGPLRNTRSNPAGRAVETRLEPPYLDALAQAMGFPDRRVIPTVGRYGIRNPMTSRIVNLRTQRQRRVFLEMTKVKYGRALFLQTGLGERGYEFRKIPNRSNAICSLYSYRLPYNIPVDRATLDLDRFLSDFQTKYSIDNDCMIRLSGKLAETDTWVSEHYQTVDELRAITRPLFVGANGTAYAEFEDLKELQISVLH